MKTIIFSVVLSILSSYCLAQARLSPDDCMDLRKDLNKMNKAYIDRLELLKIRQDQISLINSLSSDLKKSKDYVALTKYAAPISRLCEKIVSLLPWGTAGEYTIQYVRNPSLTDLSESAILKFGSDVAFNKVKQVNSWRTAATLAANIDKSIDNISLVKDSYEDLAKVDQTVVVIQTQLARLRGELVSVNNGIDKLKMQMVEIEQQKTTFNNFIKTVCK